MGEVNCGLKIFLFIIMLGPMLFVTLLLTLIGLIANSFTLLYFMLIGWICELELCEDCENCDCRCHGPFIEKTLIIPYEPLKRLCKKISFFLCPGKGNKSNQKPLVQKK